MTLILTRISKYGIIHASDSNLTYGPKLKRTGKKVFAIPYLKAALSFSGNYGVNQLFMHEWMNNFIYKQSLISKISLEIFARNLGSNLEREMVALQKTVANQIHLAGYVEENGVSHPEFWYIRNTYEINENGDYDDITPSFAVDEHFWNRDARDGIYEKASLDGVYWLYVNGFPSGRTSFLMAQEPFKRLLDEIWSNHNWKFRPPKSIADEEALVHLYVQLVNTLFISSDYDAPYIGGKIQTYCISNPET